MLDSNIVPTPQAAVFGRHGRAMARIGALFARLDLPTSFSPPPGRPLLFAGNHRSFFDILIAYAVFARLGLSSNILVRADLFERPGVGWWLRRTGCIPMSGAVREEAEASACAALRAGHTVSIMPEGRLVPAHERPDGVAPGKAGVSRIATAAGAVVIPVAFHGTDRVWPRGAPVPIPRIRRPKVTLHLGAPIELEGHDHEGNAARVMAAIRSLLDDIDRSATTSSSAPC